MYIVQSLLKWLGCTLCSLRAYFENISTGEHSIVHLIQSINSKWQNVIGQLTNSGQNCVLAKRNSTVDVLAMDVCKNRPGSKSATQSNHSTVISCFLVDHGYNILSKSRNSARASCKIFTLFTKYILPLWMVGVSELGITRSDSAWPPLVADSPYVSGPSAEDGARGACLVVEIWTKHFCPTRATFEFARSDSHLIAWKAFVAESPWIYVLESWTSEAASA